MMLDENLYQTTFVFLGMFALTYIIYNRSYRCGGNDGLSLPPSLRSFPIIGSVLVLPNVHVLHKWLLEKSDSLGYIIGFKFGSLYTVVIQSREILHEAFVKHSTEFASRPTFYYVQRLLNPKLAGIVNKPYDDGFKKYHHLSLSILKELGFGKGIMEGRISPETAEMIDRIREMNGEAFNPHSLVTASVMNVSWSILFGTRWDRSDSDLDQLISYVNNFITYVSDIELMEFLPFLRFYPPHRRKLRELQDLQSDWLSYLDKMIDKCLESGQIESFVSSFCEAEGPEFDRNELLYILRDLNLASVETSATTIRWAIVLMANHPDIQQQCQREIDSEVPAHQLPALDDRARLPYLEACILEVMRRRTVTPLAPHEVLCDTVVAGYFIPAGTAVWANLYALHMDPAVWPDPEQFQPQRFLSPEGKVVFRDKIAPFSLGKRSCLGEILARQEIFLFLSGLLQQFDIHPPEGQDQIDDTENVQFTVVPYPFSVRFIPRDR